MLEDKDLVSIQEVRTLLKKAKEAQKTLATFSQEKIDEIVKTISEKTYAKRVELAKMANEETGFGRWEDKVIKNLFASKVVYDSIKDMKTVGILREDAQEKIMEVGVPVGVVAGIIPSTNPTSTAIYKSMIAIKSGNSIVFSPHPGALKSILATVEIIREALVETGAPIDSVAVITTPTMQATQELMKHPLTNLILATGGNAMVKSAYSSGTPAIGVGPGNGPSYITNSADVVKAVKCIMDSKTFDNGTICASEQSVIVEAAMSDQVKAEFERQGGYFLTPEQADKLSKFILRPNGTMNPQIVGKDAQTIARISGITIPASAKVILAPEENVGIQYPFSREKLAPILAYYVVNNHEEACDLAIEILMGEGAGHTMSMHTESQELIREFALRKPVNRLLINTPAALGGIGASTALAPALTLGNGAVGGSASSDNITPMHLLNIRRVAYGQVSLEEIRAMDDSSAAIASNQEQLIESIVSQVFAQLQK